jgi:putative addiction module CopG family antidote
MEVHLTPDQEAFIRQAIASGRLRGEDEAAQQAFALWEARERNRMEILAALDEAENDVEAGRFSAHNEASFPQLADELKREARTFRGNRAKE